MNWIKRYFDKHTLKDTDVEKTYRSLKIIQSRLRWRRLALCLVLFLVVVYMGFLKGSVNRDHIAEIDFRGEITSPSPYRTIIDNIEQNPHVKGILIRMNSGGGQASEAEYLYNSLMSLKTQRKVPVVVFVEGAAASGAYMISIAGDHIVALNSSAVGSVGALVMVPDLENLMNNLGVSYETIRSGVEKGDPSGFNHMSEETRHHLQENVDRIADWFVGLIKNHRKLSNDQVSQIKSGGIFTGREALSLGLIDQVGGEHAVKNCMQKLVGSDLRYHRYEAKKEENFFHFLRQYVSQSYGLSHINVRL